MPVKSDDWVNAERPNRHAVAGAPHGQLTSRIAQTRLTWKNFWLRCAASRSDGSTAVVECCTDDLGGGRTSMAGKRGAPLCYDFDVILAGDFRSRGEVAETMASHLEALAAAGLDVGLYWLRDPVLGTAAPLHPRIAALVRRRTGVPIEPDAEPVHGRLLLLYEPRLLTAVPSPAPSLRADAIVVVLCQSLTRGGKPCYDVSAVQARLEDWFGPRTFWCPATPLIRAQYTQHATGLSLHSEDLTPCESTAAWRVERRFCPAARPILGRIVRYDDDRLPGKKQALLTAYPAADDIEVRFLGGESALRKLVAPIPSNWRLFGSDSVNSRRFLARLDFYLQYHDDPERLLFSRAALQAMAAGRLVVLPPAFKPVLGDGPVYRAPDQVAETVRYIQAEPRFYARYLAEQDAALQARFGPERFLRQLAGFVRLPRAGRSTRPAPRPSHPKRPTVAFYPTNGVGLGHVTRLLAIARRLKPEFEPVFFTPCHALAILEHAGFRTEYVGEPSYDETSPKDYAKAMTPRLAAALRYYDPAAIVFDGNVPRDALIAAAAESGAPMIWVRRGMWRADPTLARHVELSRFFDAVIEPSEAAATADNGVTAEAVDQPVPVPPVMLLDRADLLDAAAARQVLGLGADRPAVLVQLGSGNNNDIERHLDHITEAGAQLDLQLVVAEWLIQHNPVRRRGVRYLSAFPNARYFNAFDFAVSAAGYNSFHEMLHHGLPGIFLPNDNHKVDDQRARAAYAEEQGAGVCIPRGAESALPSYMAAMLDPTLRRLISRRARALCPTNGARAAAELIETTIARS